ncbi:PREDICTED: uncharacterized protein LOC104607643 [Nelumbo nucifera]|uniref:Uncharacterized protein n=2 Tax=Nelumbo nucifera TaxID=4432 RepID=A0A822Y9U7_NELNU|nr:PREDICTED: uncharacterized protein LOC104607643 [Nelumbo nucifera]DAD28873.1 TPA_asm: hypothetical protein HUJ06_030341 [Nelumbo nucifera]
MGGKEMALLLMLFFNLLRLPAEGSLVSALLQEHVKGDEVNERMPTGKEDGRYSFLLVNRLASAGARASGSRGRSSGGGSSARGSSAATASGGSSSTAAGTTAAIIPLYAAAGVAAASNRNGNRQISAATNNKNYCGLAAFGAAISASLVLHLHGVRM